MRDVNPVNKYFVVHFDESIVSSAIAIHSDKVSLSLLFVIHFRWGLSTIAPGIVVHFDEI